MDLVNLGYISLRTVKSEESKALGLFKSESEDIVIEIIDLTSIRKLKEIYVNWMISKKMYLIY